MPVRIESRPTQTQIKHIILEQYIKAWGGIILTGLQLLAYRAKQKNQRFKIKFVYVDCNASAGRYAGELADERAGRPQTVVYGSPIIGILGLDSLVDFASRKGITLETNAILIEKEQDRILELEQSLDMAGLSGRVHKTNNLSELQDREIAIVHGDTTAMSSELIRFTQTPFTFSLYFVDPYGPLGIPLTFIRTIVGQLRHDVIINLMYQDLQKKTGIKRNNVSTPAMEKLAANYDAIFGHSGWRKIASDLQDEQIWDEDDLMPHETLPLSARLNQIRDREIELVEMYRDTLKSIDSKLTVKSIGLKFPDKERTMFYLYLTTHDPDGALAINDILWKAGLQEHELRWRLREVAQTPVGQQSIFDLFGDNPVPGVPTVIRARPTIDAIASQISMKLGGMKITRKEIYRRFADEPYFAKEINRALEYLRSNGKAHFELPLNNDREVTVDA